MFYRFINKRINDQTTSCFESVYITFYKCAPNDEHIGLLGFQCTIVYSREKNDVGMHYIKQLLDIYNRVFMQIGN